MTKTIIALVLLAASILLNVANAEGGCPPGQYPQQGQGWQTCVPIPNASSNNGASQITHVPSTWRDQWQAVATDTPHGVLGKSIDKISGPEAEAAAMSDCRTKGGVDCRIEISISNGCVAMVVGSKFMNVKASENQNEAKKLAMSQCQSDDTNCRVYYSECSLPIEVPL
ncbi:DUF4189 domain-containing protein [Luteibacter sp. dw_328]|uniref:DUF4189 domain-containing protein n=1 Tax=Luteibacter sp. dw_328 TaxID=2719796 RepID=UPI001BD3B434|nr:DUF4189 domain-containing protein [Luteibacter sp. dw_328]